MATEDISRSAYAPRQRYASARMQQGRVITDDDFNEAERIENEDERRARIDVIGPAGSPDDGFRIGTPQVKGGAKPFVDFPIGAGTFYLGGLRLEVFAADPETYAAQGDWLQQPALERAAPTADRTDLVYLEAWQQPVEAVEDSELFEAALGGPDTSTRVRTMRRVHVAAGVTGDDCQAAWKALTAAWQAAHAGTIDPRSAELLVNATLTVGNTGDKKTDDLCSPPVAGGYLGAENQAIRVQLVDAAHFTWGFDNASPLYRCTVADDVVTLQTEVRDQAHWPVADQIVEILPWQAVLSNREKTAEPSGFLTRVKASYNPDSHVLTLTAKLPPDFDAARQSRPDAGALDAGGRYFFLRVWNRGDDTLSDPAIPFTPGTPVTLGHTGLTVTLTGDELRAGDHWIIAARPETPNRVVPWELEKGRRPHGVRRFFAPIAFVHWTVKDGVATATAVSDCRPPFKPLTELAPREGCCALTVTPHKGWEKLFAKIKPGQDASICFSPGTYYLRDTIELQGRGHIKIEGAGAGTRIVARGQECAFRFQRCKSVIVRDLAAETGLARAGKGKQTQHLQGTLTFEACGPVTVEDVSLRCANGDVRAASCITVMGTPKASVRFPRDTRALRARTAARRTAIAASEAATPVARAPVAHAPEAAAPVAHAPVAVAATEMANESTGMARRALVFSTADAQTGGVPVRIRDCNLTVGRAQVGILVVDGQRVQIEGNNIAVAEPRRKARYAQLVQGLSFRKALRSQFISKARVNPAKAEDGDVVVTVGAHEVHFRTAGPLREAWSSLLKKQPFDRVASAKDAVEYLYSIADKAILGGGASIEPLFHNYLVALRRDIRPAASQGIVVGGRTAGDVRILNNSVSGVRQGVHVGLSHRGQDRAGPADTAGRVLIAGNRVVVLLATGASRERHGIFVGSADSVIVQDNHVQVVRLASVERQPIDGIRIYGALGAMVLVERNHLDGCSTGVFVAPLNPSDGDTSLWLISQNVLAGGGLVARAWPPVNKDGNKP